jgi:hypothetical protein
MRLIAISSLTGLAAAQIITFFSDDTCDKILGSPVGYDSLSCSEVPTGALGAIVSGCPPAPSCDSEVHPLKGISFRDDFGDCYTAMYINWVSSCPCTYCGEMYGGAGLNTCFNLTIPEGDNQWGINKVFVGTDNDFFIPGCDSV